MTSCLGKSTAVTLRKISGNSKLKAPDEVQGMFIENSSEGAGCICTPASVRSDGTAAGTALVLYMRPGTNWSSPSDLTDVGGAVTGGAEGDLEPELEVGVVDGRLELQAGRGKQPQQLVGATRLGGVRRPDEAGAGKRTLVRAQLPAPDELLNGVVDQNRAGRRSDMAQLFTRQPTAQWVGAVITVHGFEDRSTCLVSEGGRKEARPGPGHGCVG